MSKNANQVERDTFFIEVERLSGEVYSSEPRLPDHRSDHRWLTGYLGDPFAPVWFVAEAPSLTSVQTQVKQAQGALSPEQQWDSSRGDKLFRAMLVKYGFKDGESEPGGWKCYITDVVKSSYKVSEWNKRPEQVRLEVAKDWAPVLRYELELGKPKLIVIVGKKTEKPLKALEQMGLIPKLPPTMTIPHYSYITSRPDRARGLGPGDPVRVAEWDAEFAAIAQQAKQLT